MRGIERVPDKGGRQEVLQQGRHGSAGSVVWVDVRVRGKHDVGVPVFRFMGLWVGVVDPQQEEEGEDEEADTEAHHQECWAAVTGFPEERTN